MRVGVDSYSFHRFFGELRAGEDGVETSWNTVDFISTVKEMGRSFQVHFRSDFVIIFVICFPHQPTLS